MSKKYYWLKLKDDFFGLKEIKKLRRMAGGDTYTIIYLKLQLLSVKNEGKLFFEGIENDFVNEVSLEIDEKVEDVNFTLMFLEKHRLIQAFEGHEYVLTKVLGCIGSEGASATRMREHRERINNKTSLCDTSVTSGDNIKRREEKSREEKEKSRVDREKKELCATTAAKNPYSVFQNNIGMTSPYIVEKMDHVVKDGVTEELLCKYIEVALERGKGNWGYIEKMALGNLKDNIRTVEEYEAYCVSRKKKAEHAKTSNVFDEIGREEGHWE